MYFVGCLRKTICTLIPSSNKFIENAPIKNQCSKDNFYQDKNYEIALSELEADTSVIFDKIMNTEDLSSKVKFTARAFMLLQETRTKHSADIVHRGFNLMMTYLESRGISDEFKPTFAVGYSVTLLQIVPSDNPHRSTIHRKNHNFASMIDTSSLITLHFVSSTAFLALELTHDATIYFILFSTYLSQNLPAS